MDTQAAYVPIAVPAETAPKHPGRVEGIIGIVCAVLAVFPFPPLFGIAGIILGSISMNKGSKALGIVSMTLSSVFIVISWFLSIAASAELEEGSGFVLGPILNLF